MAATLTWATGAFDPSTRDQASMFKKLAYAFLGVGTAAQRQTAQAEILKNFDFKAEIQATTDTSDLEALDLTDEGVTFPSRTIRDITLKSWCLTDNDTYFYESVESVLGGTTPVLLGQKLVSGWAEEAGAASEYGRVHFAATITALTTITTIFASKGYALGDISNGKAALTLPPNRLLLVKNATLDATMVSTTAAGHLVVVDHTNLDGLGTGTDGIQFVDIASATDGSAITDDPKVGTRLDLAFEVWPAFNHRLVMDSNNVTVKCVGSNNMGDDNLRHIVEVYVGPARVVSYSAV
jgi:hypothetical protein